MQTRTHAEVEQAVCALFRFNEQPRKHLKSGLIGVTPENAFPWFWGKAAISLLLIEGEIPKE